MPTSSLVLVANSEVRAGCVSMLDQYTDLFSLRRKIPQEPLVVICVGIDALSCSGAGLWFVSQARCAVSPQQVFGFGCKLWTLQQWITLLHTNGDFLFTPACFRPIYFLLAWTRGSFLFISDGSPLLQKFCRHFLKCSAEGWHWLNTRGSNLCSLRMCPLFLLLFCWKNPALAVPSSQLFKWQQCGQILWFSMFTVPLSISAAAVISQAAEATDLWFDTIAVQWFSILCFSEDITIWFQVSLFHMLPVCVQGEVLLPRMRSESFWYFPACLSTPSYTIYSGYKPILNPSLWWSPMFTKN